MGDETRRNKTAQETVAATPVGIERKALPAKAPTDEAWIAPFAVALQQGHVVYMIGSLFVGIAFEAVYLVHLLRRKASLEHSVGLASSALHGVIEGHFDDWKLTASERDVAGLMVKGLSISEWGLATKRRNGNGDNPFYIRKMKQFFDANADILVLEQYFNEPAASMMP